MKTYYTSGTIGDTYVILCKLYSVAKREKILCRHYTSYSAACLIIKEIYSLLPNIDVEFRNKGDSFVNVRGTFQHETQEAEKSKYNLVPEYYPEFELYSVEHFELPKEYVVLQVEAGTALGKRRSRLSEKVITEIQNNSSLPIVLIGTDNLKVQGRIVKDLRQKTTVKEVVKVIKDSKHFYGRAGFLSFVALSQRVYSTVFVPPKCRIAVRATVGVAEEWRKFYSKGDF